MKLEDHHIKDILFFHKQGWSSRKIANLLLVGKSTVNDVIAREKAVAPKILLFDVESAPAIAVTFRRFNTNIASSQVLEEGNWLISIAWKWYGEKKVYSEVLRVDEALDRVDWRIVHRFQEEYNKADIVVAHNGARFDIPMLKTRCLINGIKPLRKVKVIDTLQLAKKLKFESNKLDDLGKYLKVGSKVPNSGIKLWIDCMEGKPEALRIMQQYNEGDVKLLEKVFTKLLPYTNISNIGSMYDDDKMRCPACGSFNIRATGNYQYSPVSKFEEYTCDDCNHVSAGRKPVNSKDHRALQLKANV